MSKKNLWKLQVGDFPPGFRPFEILERYLYMPVTRWYLEVRLNVIKITQTRI